MAELAVRTVFSLAVVIGLLLLLARVAGRRYRGGTGAVRVVQRQALSRGSAVTVVEVGRRTLVLGVTEQQVQVLAELEPGDLDVDEVAPPRSLRAVESVEPAADKAFAEHLLAEQAALTAPDLPGRHRAAPDRPPAPTGALAGSLLSPQTWRQGWQAIARRAS